MWRLYSIFVKYKAGILGRLTIKKNIIGTIFLCLLTNLIFSQEIKSSMFSDEKVYLSLNNKLFVVGDNLYYKFYCLLDDGTPSFISKIGYVELIADNRENLFKHKLKLNTGLGWGSFFIPANVKTGHYKLVAYTKWNNKDSSIFYQEDICIINPYIIQEGIEANSKEGEFIDIALSDIKSIAKQGEIKSPIHIISDANSYKTRSKVSIKMVDESDGFNDGNYSLSVIKVNPITISNTNTYRSDEIYSKRKKSNTDLPEIRGEIISGTVKSKSSDSIKANKIVSISLAGNNYIYKNVKTDQAGKFYFSIDENYNDTHAILQVFDNEKENYRIVLDENKYKFYDKLSFKKVKLSSEIKDWILEQSIYVQIENAYYKSKEDSILVKELPNVFYEKASVDYVLDDYTRFPTLKETFIEVVDKAAIRGGEGAFRFKVFDYEEERSNYFSELDPLVLFDGILIQNSDDIIGYDPKKIEKIRIVRGVYFYGPCVFNGIIDITSKKGDFKLSTNEEYIVDIKLNSPQNHKSYYRPDYSNLEKGLSRIPDYRSQLLWEPNIQFDEDFNNIEFYTSDIEGTFEIVLEGFSLKGNYIKAKTLINVKNN